MAYIKIIFNKDIKRLERSMKKSINQYAIESCYSICNYGLNGKSIIAQEYLEVQKIWKNETQNKAVQIIQSFSKEDSQNIKPELLHEIGRELTRAIFKGHQFYIVTYVDRQHFYNRIMINPVSFENGKRIQNKKKHLYILRGKSDEICKKNGLSVIGNN